jgi:putative spermidine/putrescine transport system ATP-binding protein
LKRIHDELGVTMIYVTHDQSEALTMSDRIAVFNQGVIQHLGTPQELYNNPANVFVASFIGENNFLAVGVDRYEGETASVSGSGIAGAQVLASHRLAGGDRATLAIRPERLRVGAAVEECCNKIAARTVSTTFLGDQIRLSVQTAGGATLIVKKAMLDVFSPPPAGEPITLGFQPEDGVLLPDSEVAAAAS